MKTIYVSRKDASDSLWETLSEEALGYPIDDSYDMLEVVALEFDDDAGVYPCERKSGVLSNGSIITTYHETTKEEFRKKYSFS